MSPSLSDMADRVFKGPKVQSHAMINPSNEHELASISKYHSLFSSEPQTSSPRNILRYGGEGTFIILHGNGNVNVKRNKCGMHRTVVASRIVKR